MLVGAVGEVLKRKCGLANLLASHPHCIVKNITLDWNPSEFREAINHMQRRNLNFSKEVHRILQAYSNVHHLSPHLFVVKYESLQLNFHDTMNFLLKDLLSQRLPPTKLRSSFQVLKRSSENLKNILKNYNAIEQSIKHPSCGCLFDMLRSVEVLLFTNCSLLIRENWTCSLP